MDGSIPKMDGAAVCAVSPLFIMKEYERGGAFLQPPPISTPFKRAKILELNVLQASPKSLCNLSAPHHQP